MADKIFDDSEFYGKRFSCGCLHPTHIVDFSVEIEKDKRWIEVDFAERYTRDAMPFWSRVKIVFLFLLGRQDIWGHGFIVRETDIPEMIELLNHAHKETWTAGT